MKPTLTGSITDPDFRHRRARHAAKARTSVDHHIDKLTDAWPELTTGQLDKIAALLRPPGNSREAA